MSDPKPAVQLLLARRPIVCTRCMHGHAVETITGRENTPTEYHCGYCGNYAIVGVEAKWPFMEVVKADPSVNPANNISRKDSGENISENCGSPMQVGEALLKPKKEEKSMAKPRCEREGCGEPSEALFLCKDHFKERHGITVEEYRANKLHRTETVANVVRRLKGEPIDSYHKNEQAAAESGTPEKEKSPHEGERVLPESRVRLKPEAIAKAVAEGRISPEKGAQLRHETADPIPLFQIFLDPELLEALTVAAKKAYRTAELHAAYLIDQAVRG